MVKIKICGLSRLCDIQAVNEAKPEYAGFVFANSRRRVTPVQALELRKALSPDITPVGVFADESIFNIMPIVRHGIIDMIQLHGNETDEYVAELKLISERPVIKASPVLMPGDAQKLADSSADYLLFDNKTGGGGRPFDWGLIGRVNRPFFLAGGLNAENIAAAIEQAAPFAVDISSGVETDGLKDGEKIKSIIRRIRNG